MLTPLDRVITKFSNFEQVKKDVFSLSLFLKKKKKKIGGNKHLAKARKELTHARLNFFLLFCIEMKRRNDRSERKSKNVLNREQVRKQILGRKPIFQPFPHISCDEKRP